MAKIKINTKLYDLCPEDGCTIVDEKYYEHIKSNILTWTTDGYVMIMLKQNGGGYKSMMLHRYIMSVLEKKDIPESYVVHHINSLRYDNTVKNLEIATYSLNNAAIKREKTSSITKYKGLHFSKGVNKWVAQITYNYRTYHLGFFNSDYDAAYQHDMHHYAIHRTTIGSNNLLDDDNKKRIDENPTDFLPVAKYDDRELPKYVVQLPSGSYRVRFRAHKVDKVFQELNDATQFIEEFTKNLEKLKNDEILAKPIVRNEDGIPIIPVVKTKDNTIYYAFVDEADYYNIVKQKWCLDKDGYATSNNVMMHRLIMGCQPRDRSTIDHINRNRLDNRKSMNLRFATGSLNARNKSKREGCSSKYTGVYWKVDRDKWEAYITINGRRKHIGYFDVEEDARDAYNEVYKEIESTDQLHYSKLVNRKIPI